MRDMSTCYRNLKEEKKKKEDGFQLSDKDEKIERGFH